MPAPTIGFVTSPSEPLREAVETMLEVRQRCVWTKRVSHRDLVPYLIEEAYELIDAVERGDRAELREELGDILWQVLFHAVIAAEDPENPFDIDDIARDLTAKMIRRHPHVFGGETARTPEEVIVLWNAAKAKEKRSRKSALDGIPHGMPALALAQKMLSRVPPVATSSSASPQSEAELGEALLGLVAQAKEQGWDAERALRERLRELEEALRDSERNTK
jgi:XTP/dITP diphosphohydrolase